MKSLTKQFKEITINDITSVGGKNASLGEMYNELISEGINIPNGFATTSEAFWSFLNENNLGNKLMDLISEIDRPSYSNLNSIGEKARQLILDANLSKELSKEIVKSYALLGDGKAVDVAVRSSATAEDLPDASFAGQHESYLNINGNDNVLEAVKKCFASLYTDRAIKYREERGFKHHQVALSVGIQKMVRSDKSCSGVAFTIDPESGFENVMLLSGVWGLGENIVQGTVNPDEFYVFKPALKKGHYPIIQKKLGDKDKTMIYATSNGHAATLNINTSKAQRNIFVLNDDEIIQLANWARKIEAHYKKPMDIEWAKDGINRKLYIIQARPETVHQSKKQSILVNYELSEKGEVLVKGNAIGTKIATGTARLLTSPKEGHLVLPGDIIVTHAISPDWDPILKKSGGIITDKGGRTSHAAIVSRELGVPAIVGCGKATHIIQNGEIVTMDCAQGKLGYVYKGKLSFTEKIIDFSHIKIPKTEVKYILADPENAFQLAKYPNNGVGLLRMEFIITHVVKVHPMALLEFDKVINKSTRSKIEKLTKNHAQKETYFIDNLSQGIAMIAAAFYPKEVIVRFSDFKTNEYSNLMGGRYFEPKEENPMLGFRGASRYYSDHYKEGFRLECEAVKKVRNIMGLTNVKVMVPFCRTLKEGKQVIEVMKQFGLVQGKNGLEVYMMVEIPSNVILAEEFATIFDGFSIGSNDLTQLTLGVDRDSELMSQIFDEQDAAVRTMIKMAIEKAKATNTKIGLCGQAPSDFPEFASFLVENGIDSVSFNPDALLKGIETIALVENKNTEL